LDADADTLLEVKFREVMRDPYPTLATRDSVIKEIARANNKEKARRRHPFFTAWVMDRLISGTNMAPTKEKTV
jgi:hypothetical protein